MQNTLHWQFNQSATEIGLPDQLLTLGPAFGSSDLPLEALMLLPSGKGGSGFVTWLSTKQSVTPDRGVGLYLGDPFISAHRIGPVLQSKGVKWVTNLPSIAQHDPQLRHDLGDVGFSVAQELTQLAAFRATGLRTLAVISEVAHVEDLALAPADAVLIVQSTTDLQISFPAETQRQTLAANVQGRMVELGLSIPVVSMVTQSEWDRVTYPALARPIPGQPLSP